MPALEPPAPLKPDWQTIELRAVAFTYDGGFRVGTIDLTLHHGEQVFLVSGNGSGKTTLARLLTGLYRPRPAKSASMTCP